MTAQKSNPLPDQVWLARTQAGLTQAQFGERLGRSERAVQEWEAGNRRMPSGLWALSQMLDRPGSSQVE